MGEWKDNAMWRHPMPQGKTERERQLELDLEQAKAENLRQEVAKMNKEQEYWWQVRIQAAIKLTCALSEKMLGTGYSERQIVKQAVELADALVAELKRSEDMYAEFRRMDAINTSSICENMTKIQKELQKKGGEK